MPLSFFQTSNELCQKPYGKAIQTKALLIDFLNLHGNTLVLQKNLFLFLSQWKKFYNLTFADTFKVYCCVLY